MLEVMISSQLVDRAGHRSLAISTGVDRGSGDLDQIKDALKATSAVMQGKTIAHMHDPSQQFDIENVDTINLSDGRKLSVYWAKELFGSVGDPHLLMEKRRLSAIIVSSRGQKLLVWTEPTLDNRVGVAIHNDYGKVLLTGIGDVIDGSHGPEFISFGSAVYAWKTASPSGCAHTDWAKKKKKN